MSSLNLVELDALEILVIVDNEVDPISTYQNPALKVSGQMVDIGLRSQTAAHGRGNASKELRMDGICCGAHGLSLMITGIKGDKRHTVLFDTGPEEDVWERNVNRLKPDIAAIELIHLSHWHRDHSGGMLRAIRLINAAKKAASQTSSNPAPVSLTADLHPSRPTYRGIMAATPISLEADPTFDEIAAAGAAVAQHAEPHAVCGDMFVVSGMIPRVTAYETGLVRGIRFNDETGSWEKDELIADERLLMCRLKGTISPSNPALPYPATNQAIRKGIVVFTGCSHAGVVNASRHALELAGGGGSVPLYAVVGGYHLVGPFNEPQVPETVRDLKKLNPTVLLPGHCSGWRVKFEIEREMPGRLAPSTVGTHFTL